MKLELAQVFTPTGVDRAQGVIQGVSVITEGPALGHGVTVDAITLRQVVECASQYKGGLKVVDAHVTGQHSIFATIGYLRNFRIEGKQVKADLHLLKSEPGTEKLFEMAETIPDTFGLSIAFANTTETVNGEARARCTEIYNAALVDTPAANPTGLFSSKVDALVKSKAMPTEEEFSTFSKSFSEFTAASEARFAKLEKAVQEIAECSKGMKEYSALEKKLTELSTVVEGHKTELSSRTELAKAVAKEFAGVIGTLPAARQVTQTEPTGPAANDPIHFTEAAKKHFAEVKNEVQAMKLAMKEHPESYKSFTAQGKRLTLKAS